MFYNLSRLAWQNALWLFLTVLLPLFFIGSLGNSSRSLMFIWNFGHVLFFSILSYLLLRHFGQFLLKGFFRQLIVILLLSLLLGGLIEWLQSGLGRESDYQDMMRNSLGAVLGFCCYRYKVIRLAPMNKEEKYYWLALCSLVVIALALQGACLAAIVLDEWRQKNDFPMLANFESSMEAGRWDGAARKISSQQASSGSQSLKVSLGTQQYSGAHLHDLSGDWSAYDYLLFDIYSTEEKPVPLTIRIHDRWHRMGEQPYSDRFNHSFIVSSGWNSLAINLKDIATAPLMRNMDLTAIDGLGIFTIAAKYEQTIYIDNIRLEKNK